ncbi:hypothetical protein SLE2022_055830 [Rubroshorea leprosula]
MEEQAAPDPNTSNPGQGSDRSEPVRSRWTPKPEQILILESIFNSGMVNPPKDETVRIRKLLEKFGTVGDANVFYWFQNRRSRSRRRQRQLQASLAGEQRNNASNNNFQAQTGGAIQYDNNTAAAIAYAAAATAASPSFPSSHSSYFVGSSSSCGGISEDGVGNFFADQMGFQEIDQSSSIFCPSESSNLHYQSGFITVFINGVATEVPRGPLDIRAMFGQDAILVHSSGVPVPMNEFGYVMQSLQHGESYFLVARPT